MGFPCNGLAPISRSSLSLRCTSDTYSLHMHRMPIRKTDTQEQAKLDLGYLFDGRGTGNERLFTDTMLAIFYQFDKL